MPGPTMGMPSALALGSSVGQRLAASSAVGFDWGWKFGSLKVSKNFASLGMVPFTLEPPHIIGTNSTLPVPLMSQLYHQPTAGEKAGPGAVLAAMPRLQLVVDGAP